MRSTDPEQEGKSTVVVTGALLLMPVLCCGLGLLTAGGVLTWIGAWLGNPWLIGAAGALVAGGVAWRIRRHTNSAAADRECGAPESGRPPR